MAHWKDRLRRASFRGVEFFVRTAESEHGRRRARHEFFEKEFPFNEDLGRRVREFRFTAYLVDNEYLDQAEVLIAAFQKKGSGELVHPYQGTHQVTVVSARRRESEEEGGIAWFSVVMEETGKNDSPREGVDRAGAARASADAVNAAADESLQENLVTSGVPEFVRDASAAEVSRFGSIIAAVDVVSGITEEVSQLKDEAERLIAGATAFVLEPAVMVIAVRDAIQTVQNAVGNAIGALDAYRTLFGVSPTNPARDPLTSGSTQVQADDNAKATTDLFSQIVVAEAVRVAVGIQWDSQDQAIEGRAAILEEIDRISGTSTDTVFFQLQNLRAALVFAVPPAGESLPEIDVFTPVSTMPALLIAYQLYDDFGRDLEIATRNDLRHPGFVPGGVPIEVLTSV